MIIYFGVMERLGSSYWLLQRDLDCIPSHFLLSFDLDHETTSMRRASCEIDA